jgi:DNA-binding GntR family transcriptional regulator
VAIQKSSLVDQVYKKLRDDIITLQIPLNSKLNVNELQESLGVSCTPIREAINRLQQEGLVTYENNVGARVLSLDAHDVEEIQQLAMTLHCAAIRLAMERVEHEVLAVEIEKYLGEYERAKSIQSEVMSVHRLVGAFYHHCGNRRLDKSMISIQGQQLLLRYIYASGKGPLKNSEDFKNMLCGVRTSDAELVCSALQKNASESMPVILAYIRGELKEK